MNSDPDYMVFPQTWFFNQEDPLLLHASIIWLKHNDCNTFMDWLAVNDVKCKQITFADLIWEFTPEQKAAFNLTFS